MNYRKTRSILEDLKVEVQARQDKEAELLKVTMAVEQAGEVIVITDPAGTIQYANPALKR
jgi:two-component system, cell cycle sensor histidine kinase and response regulator CckA